MMRACLTALLFMAASMVPADAWACPACALRDDGGIGAQLVLAGMMMLPFGVAGVVIHTIRKASKQEENDISGDAGDGDHAS